MINRSNNWLRAASGVTLLFLSACTTPSAATSIRAPIDVVSVEAAEANARQDFRSFFSGNEMAGHKLSPNGQMIAYIKREERGGGLYVFEIASGVETRIGNGRPGMGVFWSFDSRSLFIETPRQIIFTEIGGGGDPNVILEKSSEARFEIVASDPNELAVFVRIVGEAGSSISKLHSNTTSELLYETSDQITGQAFSQEGRLTYVKTITEDQQIVVGIEGDAGSFQISCDAIDPCLLISSDEHGHLNLLSDMGGDLRGLVKIDRDQQAIIARHIDKRGIGDAIDVVMGQTLDKPIFMGFAHNPNGHQFFEPDLEQLLIKGGVPLEHATVQVQAANDKARYLIVAEDASSPVSRYFFADFADRKVKELFVGEGSDPSAKQGVLKTAFSFTARDGLEIYGFISLPPGQALVKTPIVVRVHGGPWARARNEYDPIVQLLVNRGYAVFEPNFRGSTGYGRRYRAAAKATFGEDSRVSQDIVDGVRWLQNLGIGTDVPVAISGHSFGGFETYAGLSFNGEVFSVGIAESGPADIGPSLKKAASGAAPDTGLPRTARFKLDGIDVKASDYWDALTAKSPSASPRISGSLLMFGGGQDPLVSSARMQTYAEQLDQNSADVTLLIDPEGGHNIDNRRMRLAYLYMIEAFLAHHLGGTRTEEVPAPILQYIEDHIVVGDTQPAWLIGDH